MKRDAFAALNCLNLVKNVSFFLHITGYLLKNPTFFYRSVSINLIRYLDSSHIMRKRHSNIRAIAQKTTVLSNRQFNCSKNSVNEQMR